jgi:cyclopropane fatty-acyl-phospholipid synthase-like methyltransferase
VAAVIECPVCGQEARKEFVAQFCVVAKCGNPRCGHLFAISPPSGTGIHEHAESYADFYASRNRALANKLVSLGLLRPGARVLDIGSGLGHIMSAVRERVPDSAITCVEAAPKSIAYLRRNNFEVLEDYSLLPGSGLHDLIFMVEVIEHLNDPVAALRLCHSRLAPGGKMFLTTPSGELRNGSHRTDAYKTAEHVQFFTQSSLCLAAEMAGFQSVKYFEMREFHAGSANKMRKWIKDSLRTARNLLQGRHHFVAVLDK